MGFKLKNIIKAVAKPVGQVVSGAGKAVTSAVKPVADTVVKNVAQPVLSTVSNAAKNVVDTGITILGKTTDVVGSGINKAVVEPVGKAVTEEVIKPVGKELTSILSPTLEDVSTFVKKAGEETVDTLGKVANAGDKLVFGPDIEIPDYPDPPLVPGVDDARSGQNRRDARRRRRGYAATVLTGPKGVLSKADPKRSTLIGK